MRGWAPHEPGPSPRGLRGSHRALRRRGTRILRAHPRDRGSARRGGVGVPSTAGRGCALEGGGGLLRSGRSDAVRRGASEPGNPDGGVLGPGVLPPAVSATARALVVVAALVAVGTALVYGQLRDAGPIERVTLRSGSYADFRQVLTREAPADVSVPATLRFPDQPRDRYPAVVVVHTISGFKEANEGWLAAELRRSGFATLTYDSLSARGLSQSAVVGSRAGPPTASASSASRSAARWRTSPRSRRSVPRWGRGRRGSRLTSPPIQVAPTACGPRRARIPALRS